MGKKIQNEKVEKITGKSKAKSKAVSEVKPAKKTNIKKEKATKIQKVEEIEKIEIPTQSEEKKDDKVLDDKEESEIIEDINKRYEIILKDIQEKLDSKLDTDLIKKGIKCIKQIVMEKYKNSLNILQNEQEEFLYLNFVLGKLPFKFSLRPSSIPLPHSLYGEAFNTRVCLFVKDPRSDFKDLNITNLPFKLKVLDVNQLKLKYSTFQHRRNLLKEYELFLCDSKIYMLLKKLLGKPFYANKKYPVPLKFDYSNPEAIREDIISHVEKCSTFYMTHGPNYTVKIARAMTSDEEICENIKQGVSRTLAHVFKWGANLEE